MTDATARRAAFALGLGWVLLIAGLLSAPPLRNVDWGWQIQTGERILAERSVDLPDRFTVAGSGGTIPPVHWLYEVGLALTHRVAGVEGLAVLRMALVLALYGLLYGIATRHGMPPAFAAAATAAAATASWIRLVLRPQLISFLFSAALVGLLLEARRRPRLLLAVPPLFALWANLHPGAILGLGVLGAFASGELFTRVLWPRWRGERVPDPGRAAALYAGLIGASALATLASPSGTQLWTWMWDHRSLFQRFPIGELAPFDLSHPLNRFNLYIALALLSLGGRRLWRDPACWLPVAFFTALTVNTNRFAPQVLDMIVLAVAATWSAAPPHPLWRWTRGAVATGLVVVSALGALNAARAPHPLLHPFANVPGAADFLLEQPTPEPIYNTNQLGGYLIYRLAGKRRIFWSGRPTLYEPLWGLEWQELDARFAFGTLVLADTDQPHAADLPGAEARWRLAYFDDRARVYVDVTADDAAWSERGFRHVSLRRPQRRPGLGLVPTIGDPEAALAELASQQRRDPQGYYTNLALARAQLALGRRGDALASATRALETRDTPLARSVLEESRGRPGG